MKQIIAILRNERVEDTKNALETIGVKGVTFLYVSGRGQPKGKVSAWELDRYRNQKLWMPVRNPQNAGASNDDRTEEAGSPLQSDIKFTFGFLPKRMLIIVACDKEVSRIIQAIVDANLTGCHGDGRIFICPMISAIRVRTGEQGNKALS